MEFILFPVESPESEETMLRITHRHQSVDFKRPFYPMYSDPIPPAGVDRLNAFFSALPLDGQQSWWNFYTIVKASQENERLNTLDESRVHVDRLRAIFERTARSWIHTQHEESQQSQSPKAAKPPALVTRAADLFTLLMVPVTGYHDVIDLNSTFDSTDTPPTSDDPRFTPCA